MRYRPELDGVRALAVLAVLASHTQNPFATGGWTGVDVFFVLSGYLITTLLLDEHAATGRIALGRFYARRALRLYPALLLLLASGVVFHDALGGGSLAGYGRSALLSGLYLQDFAAVFAEPWVVGLGHTWSLAVEEQFYLVWPVVLVLLLRYRRDPLVWALAGVVAGWVSMVVSMRPSSEGVPKASYYLPWNAFPHLLVGCALAVVVARRGVPAVVARTSTGALAAAACVVVTLVAARFGRYPGLAWQAPVIALAAGLLVWHLAGTQPSPVRRALSVRPLTWLGRRSYGVYLFHLPVLEVLQAYAPWRRSVLGLAMVALTILIAAVSYRFVELPFLRLKGRFTVPEGPRDPTRTAARRPTPGAPPHLASPAVRPRRRVTP